MPVKDGLTAEQVEQRKALAARLEERRRWAEFQRIYERCVAIAEATWSDRLDSAQLVQNDLAEGMRDRTIDLLPLMGNLQRGAEVKVTTGPNGGPMRVQREIPVPLFTPRDREQFIKEVAATLLISADRRNLTALPEPKDAETKPPEGSEAAPEAASGTDEVSPVESGSAAL